MLEYMMRSPSYSFGRPDEVELQWGLTGLIGYQIGAIITYSGAIETYLELAIWRLSDFDPSGVRPPTDAVEFSRLLEQLNECVTDADIEFKKLVEVWIQAAGYGAHLRNNIAHGIAGRFGASTAYSRNSSRYGELRKRSFGSTWMDVPTGDMLRGAYSTLLRIIAMIANRDLAIEKTVTKDALRAVREARSMLAEFSEK